MIPAVTRQAERQQSGSGRALKSETQQEGTTATIITQVGVKRGEGKKRKYSKKKVWRRSWGNVGLFSCFLKIQFGSGTSKRSCGCFYMDTAHSVMGPKVTWAVTPTAQ